MKIEEQIKYLSRELSRYWLNEIDGRQKIGRTETLEKDIANDFENQLHKFITLAHAQGVRQGLEKAAEIADDMIVEEHEQDLRDEQMGLMRDNSMFKRISSYESVLENIRKEISKVDGGEK